MIARRVVKPEIGNYFARCIIAAAVPVIALLSFYCIGSWLSKLGEKFDGRRGLEASSGLHWQVSGAPKAAAGADSSMRHKSIYALTIDKDRTKRYNISASAPRWVREGRSRFRCIACTLRDGA